MKKSFTYDGHRYYVYGKTEKETIMKMADKLRDLKEHKVIVSSNMTVSEWAYKAQNAYKSNLCEASMQRFETRLKRWVIEEIGDKKLKDVKPIDCQIILNKQAGKSKAQIDYVYQTLRFVFRTAADNELIYKSPADNLTKPTGYKHSRRAITEYEEEHLIRACSNFENGDAFLFMLFCGCRPSEAIKLQHRDFVLMKNVPMLHIRGTKTQNADRLVPCPPDLYEKYHKDSSENIFKTSRGTNISEEKYRRLCARLYREMNISMGCQIYRNKLVPPFPLADDFVPYNLRHTYCTKLARSGIDIRIAQKLMGHSSIELTANIYTHIQNDDLISVSETLFCGKVWGKKSESPCDATDYKPLRNESVVGSIPTTSSTK